MHRFSESFRVKAFSHSWVSSSLELAHLSVARDWTIALMNTVLLCFCLTWLLCEERRHRSWGDQGRSWGSWSTQDRISASHIVIAYCELGNNLPAANLHVTWDSSRVTLIGFHALSIFVFNGWTHFFLIALNYTAFFCSPVLNSGLKLHFIFMF